MKKCKVKISFFDSKPHKAGAIEEFTDAEANRHALAGRVEIVKPRKKSAKKKTATKKPAISSSKKSAGALAKPKPKKKPAAKPKKKRGKKNA